jgi:hypothetical protein
MAGVAIMVAAASVPLPLFLRSHTASLPVAATSMSPSPSTSSTARPCVPLPVIEYVVTGWNRPPPMPSRIETEPPALSLVMTSIFPSPFMSAFSFGLGALPTGLVGSMIGP